MDVENAVICPACGARNKATWEFCARCAEPLDTSSATTTALQALAADAEAPAEEPALDYQEDGAPDTAASVGWALVLVLLAFGGVGAIYWSIKSGKPESVT